MRNKVNTLLLLIALAIIALGAGIIPHLKFANNFDDYSILSEKSISEIRSFQHQFKDYPTQDVLILKSTASDNWHTKKGIKQISAITDLLETKFPNNTFSSISNFRMPKKGAFGVKNPLLINDSLYVDIHQLSRDYQDVFPKFISKNGNYALIYVSRDSVLEGTHIKAEVSDVFPNDQLIFYSENELWNGMKSETQESLWFTMGSICILILGLFYALSGSLKALVILLLMLLMNLSITFLLIFVFDFKITAHLTTLPGLVAVMTFSDVMHVLYFKYRQIQGQESSKSQLILALIFTTLSNCIGFGLFLSFSENQLILELSWIGICSLTLALLFAKGLLFLYQPKQLKFNQRIINYINNLGEKWTNSNRLKTLFYAPVLIFTITGSFEVYRKIVIDYPTTVSIESEHEWEQGLAILANEFYGSKQVQIGVSLQRDLRFTDQKVIQMIGKLEGHINEHFKPMYVSSPNQVLRRFNRFYKFGRKEEFIIPEVMSENYIDAFEKSKKKAGWREVVSEHEREGRLIFGFNKAGIPQRMDLYKELENQISKLESMELEGAVYSEDYAKDMEEWGFIQLAIKAFGITILLMTLVMLIISKHILTALKFMFVNLFPMVLALVLFIFIGIELNSVSIFMLSILLGICLDDSIYLVIYKKNTGYSQQVYYPIIVTTLILSVGMLGFGMSSFDWLAGFSIVFFSSFLTALLADVVILGGSKKAV
ncbi:hypothetical protein K6119_18805 [Paracrocinitomix mangrovi]|uniref:hypothetical protein n=1 Tax=Paracrocinitomix mangrovi TaxID=2862509 RepID=UPI001C8ECC56|nr:hypothetical protein [Paracrocinitomix mangrovi]UKN01777.1 hypothetical protein K6119_18805 [Paracrocinitomix mangrovi]